MARVGARIKRTTNIAMPSWSLLPIPFETASWDTDGHFSLSHPTRLTCRVPGTYLIIGSNSFAANAVGVRDLGIKLNDTTFISGVRQLNTGSSLSTDQISQTLWQLVADDYVELFMLHYVNPPGTNLNLLVQTDFAPTFSMIRISD